MIVSHFNFYFFDDSSDLHSYFEELMYVGPSQAHKVLRVVVIPEIQWGLIRWTSSVHAVMRHQWEGGLQWPKWWHAAEADSHTLQVGLARTKQTHTPRVDLWKALQYFTSHVSACHYC